MWNLSKASYYADFLTIPFLGLSVLISDVWARGRLPYLTVALMLVGFAFWTFIEYGVHRWVLHRAYRREHWVHHARPSAYVGVPPYQTLIAFACATGGLVGGLGLDAGAGALTGLIAGYILYIWAHDRFHHGGKLAGYWHRRQQAHAVHHARGIEANFGVVTPAWDMLLGTFRRP